MTNKMRGDIEVKLGGSTWKMRPTFEALIEIEDDTGMGVVELTRRIWDRRFGGKEIVAVITAGVRAGHDDAPSREEIGRMVVEQGVANFFEPVLTFLAYVIAGGKTGESGGSKKKVKTSESND